MSAFEQSEGGKTPPSTLRHSAKPQKRRKVDATGRSREDAKHVRLYRWLLNSPAYQSLPHTARSLLVELYGLFDGANNGRLFLSVRDAAERLGVAIGTAQRSFDALVDRGFIRVNQPGSFTWKQRHARQWVLTEYEFGGLPATKDFMRWRPTEIKKPVAKIDTGCINHCDSTPSNVA